MPLRRSLAALALAAAAAACSGGAGSETAATDSPAAAPAPAGEAVASTGGQSGVKDDESQKDVVKVAVGSPDHKTLVAAVQAADLVNSLSNAGPFTVFAPTDAAFAKLPKGTVEDLLKPENKDKLVSILQHHVTVSAIDPESLQDGQDLGMVEGGAVKISRKGADLFIGDAKVLGTVRASNGMVYVIDGVLLPK